jgi:hypothetical protein
MVYRGRPLIVYVNALLGLYVVAAATGGTVYRYQDTWWQTVPDLRLKYDLLFGLFMVLFTILVNIGLLLMKEWGRVFALAWNFLLFFSFFLMRVGVGLYLHFSQGVPFTYLSNLISIDAAIVSVICVISFAGLSTKKTAILFCGTKGT